MPLRVVRLDGIALNTNTAAAIDHAVDHGAAVVNVSLYGPHSPQRLRDAIVRARAAGVLVVAAAGNEGSPDPQYPAAFPEAISVGAAAADGRLTRYSSFGGWLKFATPGRWCGHRQEQNPARDVGRESARGGVVARFALALRSRAQLEEPSPGPPAPSGRVRHRGRRRGTRARPTSQTNRSSSALSSATLSGLRGRVMRPGSGGDVSVGVLRTMPAMKAATTSGTPNETDAGFELRVVASSRNRPGYVARHPRRRASDVSSTDDRRPAAGRCSLVARTGSWAGRRSRSPRAGCCRRLLMGGQGRGTARPRDRGYACGGGGRLELVRVGRGPQQADERRVAGNERSQL
jgi:hypothetical protein